MQLLPIAHLSLLAASSRAQSVRLSTSSLPATRREAIDHWAPGAAPI